MKLVEDSDAWIAFPQYRKWFDKLYLAQTLGHHCGPSGLAPTKSDYYIVRPTYNLSGMGAGARIQFIEQNDASCVEPGYFWCEIFSGTHYSITYVNNKWHNCWAAHYSDSLRISKWTRTDKRIELPTFITELNAPVLNVETINDKIIEIHFRHSPDPDYDELIPVWSDMPIEKDSSYRYIESFDNANSFLPFYRKGFYVK